MHCSTIEDKDQKGKSDLPGPKIIYLKLIINSNMKTKICDIVATGISSVTNYNIFVSNIRYSGR